MSGVFPDEIGKALEESGRHKQGSRDLQRHDRERHHLRGSLFEMKGARSDHAPREPMRREGTNRSAATRVTGVARTATRWTRADTGLDVWIDTDHLGPVRPGDDGSATFVVRRHKQWLINTAKMEASPTFRPDETSRAKKQMTTLHGLFLWDGSRASGDPDDSSDFVREVTRFNGYRGEVKIIDLTKNAMHVKKKTARIAKRSPSKPVVHARKPLRPQFAVGGARS